MTQAKWKAPHAPDGVARAEADPVGDGAVLVLLLGQRPLRAERLLRRLSSSVHDLSEVGR